MTQPPPTPGTTHMRTAADWDGRYKAGDLPWNVGVPDPRLTALLPVIKLPVAAGLDLGCGTGDNTIYMAQRGLKTTGVDISATAVEMAKAKAAQAGVTAAFFCADILQGLPVPAGSAGLVFDRGCFHSIDPADHPTFVRRVADALAADGCWVTLCGNADEVRPTGMGPPQLTASQILAAVTPCFALHHLERIHFKDAHGNAHLGWEGIFRKR